MKTQGGAGSFTEGELRPEIQGVHRQGIQEAAGGDQDRLRRPADPWRRQRDDQSRHAPREHGRRSRPHPVACATRSCSKNTAWRPRTSTATAAATTASRRPAESPSPTSSATSATTKSTASANAPASSTRPSRPTPATWPRADLAAAQAACPHGLPRRRTHPPRRKPSAKQNIPTAVLPPTQPVRQPANSPPCKGWVRGVKAAHAE